MCMHVLGEFTFGVVHMYLRYCSLETGYSTILSLFSFFVYLFETRDFHWFETYQVGQAYWPSNPRDLPISAFLALGL